MTPEEKAKEIIVKFEDVDSCDKHWHEQDSPCSHQAKQCAIICVEQIMEELKDVLEITASSYVREEISQYNKVIERIKNS